MSNNSYFGGIAAPGEICRQQGYGDGGTDV